MATQPEDSIDEPRLDRTKLSVVPLTEPDDSLQYWLSRPVIERLQALERLRRTFYGDRASERLQKVLEFVKLEPR